MEIPVPQMHVRMTREGQHMEEREHPGNEPAPLSPVERSGAAAARDVSHEPRPAPPPTDQSVQVPPQIPTATEPGKA
jgi:small conductance mechanosensitive channel